MENKIASQIKANYVLARNCMQGFCGFLFLVNIKIF